MNFLNIDIKKLVFYILMALLPLLSINAERKLPHAAWFDQPLAWVTGITQGSVTSLFHAIKETTSLYLDLIAIKKENSRLKVENAQLSAVQLQMNELESENARLKTLLGFRQDSKMTLVAAQVMGRDLLVDHNSMTLNKGENDGLKKGQAVMTTQGAVGHIFRVTNNTAHVMLITDRYSAIDGIVQRTRTHGIVEGRGNNQSHLKYVERASELSIGDIIVTGGLDQIFPKGLPMAKISAIQNKEKSTTTHIELTPVVNPYEVENVFVIIDSQSEDLTTRFDETSTEDVQDANQSP